MVKTHKNAKKALQQLKEEMGKELSIIPSDKKVSAQQNKDTDTLNDVYTHLGRS